MPSLFIRLSWAGDGGVGLGGGREVPFGGMKTLGAEGQPESFCNWDLGQLKLRDAQEMLSSLGSISSLVPITAGPLFSQNLPCFCQLLQSAYVAPRMKG